MLKYRNRPSGLFYRGDILKREEKNALAKKRILNAAMDEFSTNGYQGATLNRVWKEKNISKGMIYHYYNDKDEIYLTCVKECFTSLISYLKDYQKISDVSIEDNIQNYFDVRLNFFAENPNYLGIFLDASLNAPDHLKNQIQDIKKEFEDINISILKDILQNVDLRADLSMDSLIESFRIYTNYFNLAFKDMLNKNLSKEDAMKEHEKRIQKQLNIMLYGILERKN